MLHLRNLDHGRIATYMYFKTDLAYAHHFMKKNQSLSAFSCEEQSILDQSNHENNGHVTSKHGP